MIIKTYGAPGYMEWHAVIPVGKAQMRVVFKGGVPSGYGDTPAEFTTSDPNTQALIEGSKYFADGKVVVLREIGGEPEHQEEQPKAEKQQVKVTDLDDAKNWLMANRGLTARALRSRANILDAAAANNIEFIGL